MASFTDKTPRFNPYIQQQPVEAMVAVGTQKQKLYEEGVQKIQTQVDNIAGLDVVRDVDKAYLQSKLNQLGNNLRTVASGDFSNFQLVNSVSGMTKQLIRDEGIQNAVNSAAKLRKEQAFMEEEKKKGNLDPSNEYHFNKRVNSWMQSSDVNQGLNAKYVPHFDIQKFAKETFDAIKPDGFSYDQIYELDANGKPVHDKQGNLVYSTTMTRMEKEGIFPEKVKATLNQIFSDPRVSQQLGISGEYNYRNFDSNNLRTVVVGQREKLESDYTDKIYNLYLNKSMGKGNQEEIDATERGLENIKSSYAKYEQMAYDNPDAVRGLLYKDEVNNRFTTMFGQTKSKTQVLANPAADFEFKLQQEANEQSRFAQTLAQTKLAHKEDMTYKYTALAQQERLFDKGLAAKAEEAAIKAGKKKAGFGEATGPAGLTPEQANQESSTKAEEVQMGNYETTKDNYIMANDNFLWQTIFKNAGNNNANLQKMVDAGVPESDAKKRMIEAAAKKQGMTPAEYRAKWNSKATSVYNSLPPAERAKNKILVDSYQLYKNTGREYSNELQIKNRIQDRLNLRLGEFSKELELKDVKPEKVTYLDKEYTMDKHDMMDLAIIKKSAMNNFVSASETKAAEQATKRITAKGKGELINALVEDSRFDPSAMAQIFPWLKGVLKDYGGVKTLYRGLAYKSEGLMSPGRSWKSVDKIGDMLNSQPYRDAMVEKEKIIKEAYGIKPNLKVGLVSGKNEIDSQTLANLKRMGGAYMASDVGNLSSDFKKFVGSLSDDMKKNNLEANVIMGPDRTPMVEIVSYDDAGNRTAGMVIQEDEAATLGIDINALYDPREISSLKSRMNLNANQTSAGDPSDVGTYKQADSYYNQSDFPLLQGTDFEAQANFIQDSNTYYPYIYVTDGKKSVVRPLPGHGNLREATNAVKATDQSMAKQILLGK